MKISKILWIVTAFIFLCQSFSVSEWPTYTKEEPSKEIELSSSSRTFQIAYTTSYDSNQITPIDLQTGTTGYPLILNYHPKALVISPNARIAYIFPTDSNQIIPIELETGRLDEPLTFEQPPQAMVITSDGQTAYVTHEDSNRMTKVNLAIGQIESIYILEKIPLHLSLTLDDKMIYLTYQRQQEVACIDLDSFTPKSSIFLNDIPQAIAINQSGKSVYISQSHLDQLTLSDFENSQTTNQIAQNNEWIDLDKQVQSLDMSLDGQVVYLTHTDSNEITSINLAKKISDVPIQLDHKIQSLALYPRQTLLASFTTKAGYAGQLTFFDASKTQPFRGAIVDYFWDFGDGQTLWSYTPLISHLYEEAGFFNVELIVTESMESFPFTQLGHEIIDKTHPLKAKSIQSIEIKAKVNEENFNKEQMFTPLQTGLNLISTTTLNSSANPSVFGQTVTFTATVSGDSIPSGTVTFYSEATPIGTSTLNASGIATLSVSDLDIGNSTITASYSGDNIFAGSTSPAVMQAIDQAGTTTRLLSSVNPSVFGQSTTLTATVI